MSNNRSKLGSFTAESSQGRALLSSAAKQAPVTAPNSDREKVTSHSCRVTPSSSSNLMVTTAAATAEWVFFKFHPSRFTNPNRPLTSRGSNRLGFRRFSSSASLSVAAAASSSTVNEVDPKREPVSLGHATRPDFPILHQVQKISSGHV